MTSPVGKLRVEISRDSVIEALRARPGHVIGLGTLGGRPGGAPRKGVFHVLHQLLAEGLVERVKRKNGWGYRLRP